jgi:hypothetical protein
VPYAWPRGKTSFGWKNISELPDSTYDYLLHSNYARLVSLQGRIATFKSYTYEVFDSSGTTSLGWYPISLSDHYRLDYSFIQGPWGTTSVEDTARREHQHPLTILRNPVVGLEPVGIRLVAPVPGEYRLGVYSVDGRLVKLILDGLALRSLPTDVAWDRRDASGAPVAAGIYFVRFWPAIGDRERSVSRIVVLR